MPKAPVVSGKQMLKALRKDGWFVTHIEGSHHYLRHDTKPGQVTVPVHRNEDLLPKTMHSILDQAGLTVDDLRRLL
jgi:predicted RNA binding protein YcfA (HicA-like mRNA interferase family)